MAASLRADSFLRRSFLFSSFFFWFGFLNPHSPFLFELGIWLWNSRVGTRLWGGNQGDEAMSFPIPILFQPHHLLRRSALHHRCAHPPWSSIMAEAEDDVLERGAEQIAEAMRMVDNGLERAAKCDIRGRRWMQGPGMVVSCACGTLHFLDSTMRLCRATTWLLRSARQQGLAVICTDRTLLFRPGPRVSPGHDSSAHTYGYTSRPSRLWACESGTCMGPFTAHRSKQVGIHNDIAFIIQGSLLLTSPYYVCELSCELCFRNVLLCK